MLKAVVFRNLSDYYFTAIIKQILSLPQLPTQALANTAWPGKNNLSKYGLFILENSHHGYRAQRRHRLGLYYYFQTQSKTRDSSLTTPALKLELQLVMGYSKSNTIVFAGFKPTKRAVLPIENGFGAGAGAAVPDTAAA